MTSATPRLATNKHKRKYAFSVMVSLCSIVLVRGAKAQPITVSFSGEISPGSGEIDTYGLFGPVGGNLSGQPFTINFTYDPTQFTQLGSSPIYSGAAGALTINVGINGITQTVTNTTDGGIITPSATSFYMASIGNPPGLPLTGPDIQIMYFTSSATSITNPLYPQFGKGPPITIQVSPTNSEAGDTLSGTLTAPFPIAANEVPSTSANNPVVIDLTAGASGTPTSAALVGTPINGTVSGFPGTTVTFTPNADFTGIGSFQFTLSNATGVSNVATATVSVAPVAADEATSTKVNTPVSIDLTLDADGSGVAGADGKGSVARHIYTDGNSSLSAELIGTPVGGTVTGFPGTTVTFTPTNGFKGTGSFQFALSSPGGTSNDAPADVFVGQLPKPVIYLNGNVLEPSAPPTVVVGQPISIFATPPNGAQSAVWKVFGSTIKNYTVSSTCPTAVLTAPPQTLPVCQAILTPTTQSDWELPGVNFYWVEPGTYPISYTYTLADGGKASSTGSVVVAGPTVTGLASSQIGTPKIGPFLNIQEALYLGGLNLTSPPIEVGIVLSPPPLSGYTFWAQKLIKNSYTINFKTASGISILRCSLPTGLDNAFPDPDIAQDGITAYDAPNIYLSNNDTSVNWAFQAQSYLMWESTTVPGAIPVPLGYVFWGFQTSATQNLSTHVWTTPTDKFSSPQFVPGNHYPQWQIVDINGTNLTNQCTTTIATQK